VKKFFIEVEESNVPLHNWFIEHKEWSNVHKAWIGMIKTYKLLKELNITPQQIEELSKEASNNGQPAATATRT